MIQRPRLARLLKHLGLALLFVLMTAAAHGQPAGTGQASITGHVVGPDGAPVSPANVQLVAAADSSFVSGTTTAEDGTFTFENVAPGTYLVQVSMLGYADHRSGGITVSEGQSTDLGEITLDKKTTQMEEATVKARQPVVEQKGDRLIVHVGDRPTLAGETVLEVLKQAPGVIVDEQSGTVSMMGKEGVRVMIDGRQSHVPEDNLVQFLKGLSAENIESVELITAPPARLEAEGNAGFINIVRKEDPTGGLNGSVSASANYGEGEIARASAELTYRQDRLRINGSYSFTHYGKFQQFTNYRRVQNGDGLLETSSTANRDPAAQYHDLRMDVEFEASDALSLGAVVGGYSHRWAMDAVSRMQVRENDAPRRRVRSEHDELNHWQHLMGSVYAETGLGGGSLRAQLDYVYYHDNNPTTYNNTYTDFESGSETKRKVTSRKRTPLDIYVGKIDYEVSPAQGLQLEAGLKGSFSRFTNRASYEGLVEREWVSDIGLAPTSHLREDILAAYGSSEYSPSDAISLKVGLRYEFTGSRLTSGEGNRLVDRRFGRLFPSVSYSHKFGEKRKLSLSYTRRITRPSFRDMAPFLWFLDPRTFSTGNLGIQPALTNTLKLDLTYGDLFGSVQYAREDGTIDGQARIIEGENVQIGFPVNYDRTHQATGTLGLSFSPTDWWTAKGDATATWQEVQGTYEEESVTKQNAYLRINSTQTVDLPREFDLEVSGYYQTASISGFRTTKPFGRLDLAVQRSLPKGLGDLTLSLNDVLDSHVKRFTRRLQGEATYIEGKYNVQHRSVEVSYSLRFGESSNTDEPTTASEEERSRANN
ncbi:MAG: outer membrane beta-barrel protein [Salinivenus sp.]